MFMFPDEIFDLSSFLHLFILTHHRSAAQWLGKAEKHNLYRELRNCLEIVEPVDGKPMDEVVSFTRS